MGRIFPVDQGVRYIKKRAWICWFVHKDEHILLKEKGVFFKIFLGRESPYVPFDQCFRVRNNHTKPPFVSSKGSCEASRCLFLPWLRGSQRMSETSSPWRDPPPIFHCLFHVRFCQGWTWSKRWFKHHVLRFIFRPLWLCVAIMRRHLVAPNITICWLEYLERPKNPSDCSRDRTDKIMIITKHILGGGFR